MKSLYCQVDIDYFKPTTAHIQSSATLNEEGDGNNYRKLIIKYRKDKIMNLQEIVFEKGLNTLFKRMETVLDSETLKKISNEVVVSAKITNLKKVENTISQIYPGLNILDVKIDIKSQAVRFRLYGECWVPKKYFCCILFKDTYSLEKTEEYNYHKVIKEEYADNYYLPLNIFNEGIEMEIV